MQEKGACKYSNRVEELVLGLCVVHGRLELVVEVVDAPPYLWSVTIIVLMDKSVVDKWYCRSGEGDSTCGV